MAFGKQVFGADGIEERHVCGDRHESVAFRGKCGGIGLHFQMSLGCILVVSWGGSSKVMSWTSLELPTMAVTKQVMCKLLARCVFASVLELYLGGFGHVGAIAGAQRLARKLLPESSFGPLNAGQC